MLSLHPLALRVTFEEGRPPKLQLLREDATVTRTAPVRRRGPGFRASPDESAEAGGGWHHTVGCGLTSALSSIVANVELSSSASGGVGAHGYGHRLRLCPVAAEVRLYVLIIQPNEPILRANQHHKQQTGRP